MANMVTGCDTFVVLPPLTSNGGVVFGKNSDRPQGEVQEIVYFPEKLADREEKLQCTYIEVEGAGKSRAVLLSKPAWMWGAEMGANDAGVVIGNEAVYTKVNVNKEERLLGMDLLRLGLERGGSAEEALDVITGLLEKYGQGGPCSDSIDFYYHNSFLIADSREAWVLETAGTVWAAQRITEGFRNISNSLSIASDIDKMSDNLKSYAVDNGLWDGKGDFNFKEVYSSGAPCPREEAGRRLLEDLTGDSHFGVDRMFTVLRDTESNICRPRTDPFPTASSQVSVLYKEGERACCHWMTGTPDASVSIFKPFIFTPDAKISQHTVSPTFSDDPAKRKPRFAWSVDRRHNLYRLHEGAVERGAGSDELRAMEAACSAEVQAFIADNRPLAEVHDLMKDVVETEIKFYK